MSYQDDWKGIWIGCPVFGAAAPRFRREFELSAPVKKARVRICGLGVYELYINGTKVGDRRMDPAVTDYGKTVLYVTYDVTSLLTPGKNCIGVWLGRGWFSSFHFNNGHTNLPLMFQMSCESQTGENTLIVSDTSPLWRVCAAGPILGNDLYDGEIYDARLEEEGWCEPGFSDVGWHRPLELPPPGGVLKPMLAEPARVTEELRVSNVFEISPLVRVYDFGQNITGVVRIRLRGARGSCVNLRHAELLSPDNRVNTENLRLAAQTDHYTLKGGDIEEYTPRFTLHGFRYLQVEAYPSWPEEFSAAALVIHTDMTRIGDFSCGEPLLNRLHEAIIRTERSNLQGVPTDCYQRDERLGWLNDAVVRMEELLYNFDAALLLSKWLDDIADTQDPFTGAISDTAPLIRFGRKPADPACCALLLAPWLLYVRNGETNALEKYYPAMKRWYGYLSRQSENGLLSYSSYGDWAAPAAEAVENSIGAGALSAVTPGDFVSSAYYFYHAELLSKTAEVLEHSDDARFYSEQANKTKQAFNAKYYDCDKKYYASGSQACQALPLYLGLVPDEHRSGVLSHLANDVISRGYHLSTGNLCTKYLIEVLADGGYTDIAYALLTQTTYPSWGYMLSRGATTIWERWEYIDSGICCEMASHSHPMYGSVGAWFYSGLCGITPLESGPGYAEIMIRPRIPSALPWAKASVETIRGRVYSGWEKIENGLKMEVEIPSGSRAEIYCPMPERESRRLFEGGRLIWENGTFLTGGTEITDISADGENLRVSAGPGRYTFTSENFTRD